MAQPIKSNFASTGRPDNLQNLAHGSKVMETTLASDLSAVESDKMLVSDASGLDRRGALVIGDEIIYYHHWDRFESEVILDLLRGQQGTIPAHHSAGTPVTILGAPRFSNPALPESVISMQQKLLELEARITALENKP